MLKLTSSPSSAAMRDGRIRKTRIFRFLFYTSTRMLDVYWMTLFTVRAAHSSIRYNSYRRCLESMIACTIPLKEETNRSHLSLSLPFSSLPTSVPPHQRRTSLQTCKTRQRPSLKLSSGRKDLNSRSRVRNGSNPKLDVSYLPPLLKVAAS